MKLGYKRSKHSKVNTNAMDILTSINPMQLTVEERAAMTISCRDADDLPRVKNAGKIIIENGKKIQITHNGIKVLAGGYYGDLIQTIIEKLKGHHEPQEEKVFHHILARINKKNPTMIELASHWSFYSLWFKKETNGTIICCEPDPHNIQIGRENVKINGYKEGDGVFFHQSAAGSNDGQIISFTQDSNPNEQIEVPVRSVDSLCKEHDVDTLDILHMDAQGVELDALHGASELIKSGKLRFVVISTHHYVYSGDTLTHRMCEDFVRTHGGHIIASHDIQESFSGDGLIVASFDKKDKNFTVPISYNHAKSLFRPYQEDVKLLIDAYNR